MKYIKKYNEDIEWNWLDEEEDPNPIFNFKIGDLVIMKEPVYYWSNIWEEIGKIKSEIIDIKRTINMTDNDYQSEYNQKKIDRIETDEWVIKIKGYWPWFRTNNIEKVN